MKLLTKLKLLACTGILVAAGALIHAYSGPPTRPALDDFWLSEMTLETTFTNPGTQGILPSFGGTGFDTVPYPPAFVSPWRRVVKVAKGSRVTFSVTQTKSGTVTCAIFQAGIQLDFDEMHGPGTLSCHAVSR